MQAKEKKEAFRHEVSGEIQEITREELSELMGKSAHDTKVMLRVFKVEQPDLTGIVVFEDLELRMPTKKHPTKPPRFILYGRHFAINPDNLLTARLGEVPSQFRYPTKIFYIPDEI